MHGVCLGAKIDIKSNRLEDDLNLVSLISLTSFRDGKIGGGTSLERKIRIFPWTRVYQGIQVMMSDRLIVME